MNWAVKTFTWGKNKEADLIIKEIKKENGTTRLHLQSAKQSYHFNVQYTDDASIENIMHCISVLIYMDVDPVEIQNRMQSLHQVAMRLELKEGINGCFIIDDTYNNDLAGLTIAINFLDQQKRKEEKTIILSDVLQSGMDEKKLYNEIANLIKGKI